MINREKAKLNHAVHPGSTAVGLRLALFVMILYAGLCLFPFFWALMVSLTPLTYIPHGGGEAVGVDIMKWPPEINVFKGIVFGAPATLSNYIRIFYLVPDFSKWILNTFIYAGVVSVGVVFFNTLAGYAFARLRFPLRDFWFAVLLATMMVPFAVTIIPIYTLLVRMGWVNTYQGLIVPRMVNVAMLFFMRQFFLNFPKSLEEAAYLDGAGIPKILFQVVLPNTRPAIAAQFIYVFLGNWNEFFWPLIVTSKKEMFTLTMGLSFFQSNFYTYWQYLMAASLLVTLPMIVLFLFFQRQFIASNMASAIKE